MKVVLGWLVANLYADILSIDYHRMLTLVLEQDKEQANHVLFQLFHWRFDRWPRFFKHLHSRGVRQGVLHAAVVRDECCGRGLTVGKVGRAERHEHRNEELVFFETCPKKRYRKKNNGS